MKEYPEPNYILRVWDLLNEKQPAVSRFLTSGWILTINHIAHVTFLPYLPTSPWPPSPASNLDFAADRDEAARIVLSTSSQLVTPTNDSDRIEELVGENPERQTVFWVAAKRYDKLDAELRAIHENPRRDDGWVRLSNLGDGALRSLLIVDLPRSTALSDYEREILCLD